MKVWNTTEADIRRAAEQAGVTLFADWNGSGGIVRDGRALNFRLALGSERVAEGTYRAANGKRKTYPLLWQRKSASPFNYVNIWGDRKGIPEEPRRVASVCWHGHYAFMRFLLALCPDARIKTAFADYHGLREFLDKAPATGDRNIGAPIYPIAMADACFCEEYGNSDTDEIDRAADLFEQWHALRRDGSTRMEFAEYLACTEPTVTLKHTVTLRPEGRETNPLGTFDTYTMSHGMIRECPFVIFSPEHYRADGSCRCDDPTHTEMRDWGYVWNGSRWTGEN